VTTREKIVSLDPNIILLDGFDEALIGIGERCGQIPLAVYDKTKCIDCLVSKGMEYRQALQYFETNVAGVWRGERTPLVVDSMPNDPI